MSTHPLISTAVLIGVFALLPAFRAAAQPASTGERDRLYDILAREAGTLQRQGMLIKKAIKLVRPAVVHIEAEKTEEGNYGPRRRVEEEGAGVVFQLNDQFYILTNRHVIVNALDPNINIRLADGRIIQPTQSWSDLGTDVGVMAVDATGLIPARLGNSDTMEIGDFVLAVGSPFGLSHSVTFGIISAKGRRDLELGVEGVRFQDFIQTDAAINPGNSGGPLLNLSGEIIGINTAIASNSGGNEGIGFSIPINMSMVVARQLIESGIVVRAYLGVHLDSRFNLDKARQLGLQQLVGACITGVTPGSPAEDVALQVDDVILKFNGVAIEDDSHLVNLVSMTPVNQEIEIVLFREQQRMTIQSTVANRADFHSRRQ